MGTITKRAWKDGAVSYLARIRRLGHPHLTATFKRKLDAKRWIDEQELKINRLRHFGYAWTDSPSSLVKDGGKANDA